MSQSKRSAPLPLPHVGHLPSSMAQSNWIPRFSPSSVLERIPEQQSPGPQLAPIHPFSLRHRGHDDGSRSVRLPPMQMPPAGTAHPVNTTFARSIPVAYLLSSDTTLPPHSRLPVSLHPPKAFQPQAHWHVNPSTQVGKTLALFPPAPACRLDRTHPPYRQQPPPATYQSEQFRPPQRQPRPITASSGPPPPLGFSPAMSAVSRSSYTESETSPRSSLASQVCAEVGAAPCRDKLLPYEYNLRIRQQPVAARACGFGERDRRVIDPPPILELNITDHAGGHPVQDLDAMFALHCTLLNTDGHDDGNELPSQRPEMLSTTRLMGSLVASPYQAKDESAVAGTFFVFPDLSCRSPGKYRLKLKLIRVDPTNMSAGAAHAASIVTDVFSVYTAKDFPGMRASSALLKALRRQGLNVGVKKGSEARKGKGKTRKHDLTEVSSSEGTDDSDEGDVTACSGMNTKSRPRKRAKRRKRDD